MTLFGDLSKVVNVILKLFYTELVEHCYLTCAYYEF